MLLLFGQGQRPMQSGRLHSGGSGRLAAAAFRLIWRLPEVQELQGVENGREPRGRPIPVRVQAFQQARHVDVSGSIRRDGAGGELAAHRRQRFGEGILRGLDSGRVGLAGVPADLGRQHRIERTAHQPTAQLAVPELLGGQPQDELQHPAVQQRVTVLDAPGRAARFTSASYGRGFSGNVQFTIHGHHGKRIDRLSAYPKEREVLFDAGTRFRVLDRRWQSGVVEIEMEEVDDA